MYTELLLGIKEIKNISMNKVSDDTSVSITSPPMQPLLSDYDGDTSNLVTFIEPTKEFRLNISDGERSNNSSLFDSTQSLSKRLSNETNDSKRQTSRLGKKRQSTRAQIYIRKIKYGILNSPTFKWSLFIIISLSIYADHLSTILSVHEFYSNGDDYYALMTMILYGFNVSLRLLYQLKKIKKENRPITMKGILYPICLLDLVVPHYNDIVAPNKYKGDILMNHEALYDIGVLLISSDCIPNCVITLYSQIYSDTISTIIMISTLTSLFSLARNMSLVVINPFLDLEAQTNNKRRGYNSQGIGEDLLELIDTYIELLSRICIITPFAYMYKPYGGWFYLITIFLFYMGYVIGANAKQKVGDILLNFCSGLFLTVVHAKQNRFYHPKTNYKPALEEDDDEIVFNFRAISLVLNNSIYWRIFQYSTIFLPLYLSLQVFDKMQGLCSIVFTIGLGSLGYTILINHFWDLFAIYRMKKEFQTYFLQPMDFDMITQFAKFLRAYPKLEKEIEEISQIIQILPELVLKYKIKFEDDLVSKIHARIIEITPRPNISENLVLNFCLIIQSESRRYGKANMIVYHPNTESKICSQIIAKKLANNNIKKLELIFSKDFLPFEIISELDSEQGLENLEELVLTSAEFLDVGKFKILFPINNKILKLSMDLGCNKQSDLILKILAENSNPEVIKELSLRINSTNTAEDSFYGLVSDFLKRYSESAQLVKFELILDVFYADRSICTFIQKQKHLSELKLEFELKTLAYNKDLLMPQLIEEICELTDLAKLNLNIKESNVTQENVKKLMENLYVLDLLEEIDINIQKCSHIDMSDNLPDLISHFHSRASLKRYQINIDNIIYCYKISDKEEIDLTKILCDVSKLEYLALDFSAYSNMLLDKHIKEFSHKIKDLASLSHLHINFSDCEFITDFGLKVLAQEGLTYLSGLKNLNLNFHNCNQISDDSLQDLAQCIQNFSELSDLSLNFYFCNMISDQGIKNLSESLESIEMIFHLSLDFQFCHEITDDAIKTLSSKIAYLKNIDKLSLNFSYCYKISDFGIKELSLHLLSLHNLTDLSLNFENCQQISKGCSKNLSSTLQGIVKIFRLDLNFSWAKNLPHLPKTHSINDEKVELVANSINKLKELTHLELNFSNCSQISDIAIMELSRNLHKLVNLSHFNLNCSNCTQVTDKGLTRMAMNSLTKLTNIQDISLDFTNCFRMSDDSIKALSKSLCQKPMLKSIKLVFSGCKELADDSIEFFSTELDQMKTITKLYLDFSCIKGQISDAGLSEIAKKGLPNLKNLKNLSLKFANNTEISDEGLNDLAEALGELENLKILLLDFEGCSSISDEAAKEIFSAIKQLSELTKLSLNFSQCPELSNESMEELGNALSEITSLKKLELDFWTNNSKIDDEGIAFISESLENHTNLSKIKLNFYNCVKITDEGLQSIAESGLQNMKSLTHLDLNFSSELWNSNSLFTNEMLSCFGENLKNLSNLISLRLNFCNNIKFTQEGISELALGIKKMKNLSQLDLNFAQCIQIDDESLQSLSNDSIGKLSRLTDLRLNLSNCTKITDEGVSYISRNVHNMNLIRSLDLNFAWCKNISDKGLKYIAYGIQKLYSLIIFKLDISNCRKICDDGVISFSQKGLQNLRALCELDINLAWCSQISNSSFIELSLVIEKLTALTSLSIDLEECPQIADNGLKEFSQKIIKLTSLSHLKLNFSSPSWITNPKVIDTSLQDFSHSLRKLAILTSLDLNFYNCSYISDESIKDIAEIGLKKLSALSKLKLNLYGCRQISDVGANALLHILNNLSALIELEVNFEQCPMITEEVEDEFIDNLQMLPGLSKLVINRKNCLDEE